MSLLPTFTTLGSGPTVLMLHDADSGHLSFAPQVETLANAGYRAVAWDMPGYGHSAPVEPYNFLGLVRRCAGLIEALECQTLSVVGHGLGAMLALELVLRGDIRISNLMLCAGGPRLDSEARERWLLPRKRALASTNSMEKMADLLVPQQIGTAALPEGVRLAGHAMSLVHRATYVRALDALCEYDRTDADLARVHQPVMVVGGSQDRTLPPMLLDALAACFPHALRLNISGVGHWPQLEAPEAFDAALLEFLAAARVLH